MRDLVTGLVVGLTVSVLPMGSAFAQSRSVDSFGDVVVGDDTFDISAEETVERAGGGVEPASSGGGGGSECSYTRMTVGSLANFTGSLQYGDPQEGAPEETVFLRACPGESPQVVSWDTSGEGGGGPVVSAGDVLTRRAWDRLGLPVPEVGMSPPGRQYTQVPTWLWVESDWRSRSASASAGSVTSTVTAEPSRVVWDMGNGDEVVCDGPGTRWVAGRHDGEAPSPDCGYTFRHSSAGRPGDVYRVTVTVVWDVRWAVAGAAGGGRLGEATSTETVEVEVGEIQTVITGYGSGR